MKMEKFNQTKEMHLEGIMTCGNYKDYLYEGIITITDLEGNERKAE